jgi:hypothetical protein
MITFNYILSVITQAYGLAGSVLVHIRQEKAVLHATEALHDACVTCNTSRSRASSVRLYLKAYETSEDIASIVILNLTTTLLLRATLFLRKSRTGVGSHPSVSVYTH